MISKAKSYVALMSKSLETPYGINDIQVTAADVILGQIFFVRA
jgi:hypothetical protein